MGAYHLLISLRRLKQGSREHLLFSLLCFSVSLYDIFSAGLYSASSPEAGAFWQRFQIVAMVLSGSFFLWFARDYTGLSSLRLPWLLTAIYGGVLLLGLWGPGGFDLLQSFPAVKHVRLPGGLLIHYHEMASGPAADILGIFGVIIFSYASCGCFRMFRQGEKRRAIPLFYTIVFLFLAVFNDSMVSSGIYRSFYLFEYAYLGMVLLMTYFLSDDLLRAIETREVLKQTEAGFQTLLQHSLQGIAVVENKRIALANVQMCAFLGYTAAEITAMPNEQLRAMIHPEDRPRILEELMAGQRHFEFRLIRKDGRTCWLEVFYGPIPYRGKPCMMGLAMDVTERKFLEAQLRQAQKMEAIGRLAGGIAHDFNNLLTGILGHTSLGLMDLSSQHPLRENLQQIEKAATSAASLTRQLLTFSRKQIIEPQVVDLNVLIKDLHKMLGRLIGEDIELQSRTQKAPARILVDPSLTEQVLINLAVNARDAMPEGGKLTIETAEVVFDEEYCQRHTEAKPGLHIMLAVSDTGVGMDTKVKEHLFEPFFTTKEKGKGTGLGLAMVYGAVKQHRGSIEVYSEVGQGTTFKIYFPRTSETDEDAVTPKVLEKPSGGNETILLVEDDSVVRNSAVRSLTRLGYVVLECANGEEALTVADRYESEIHLLLTDVIMPGMNGRTLARSLEEMRPNMKVLYTSGYTDNVIAHHGVLEEGLQFLSKPYTPQTLDQKIRQVLATSIARAASPPASPLPP